MAEQGTGASPEAAAHLLRARARSAELWVPLEGTSMLPTIEALSEGLVTAIRRPRWGEVWAFVDARGELTVHRVIARLRGDRWLLRGGGSEHTDAPVDASLLIGPVRVVRHQGRTRQLRRSRLMALRLHARRLVGLLR